MKKYSQNNEQQIIFDYFTPKNGFAIFPKGTFLDIGANDGITLSNTRALYDHGWLGICVEPSPKAAAKLNAEYGACASIQVVECAVGTQDEIMELHESDHHITTSDVGLLSSLKKSETDRWGTTQTFEKVMVEVYSWTSLLDKCKHKNFDFISIDAEGMDYEILSQMDLRALNCKLLCVEHNGNEIEKYISYCEKFGMKEIHRNAENLIMGL